MINPKINPTASEISPKKTNGAIAAGDEANKNAEIKKIKAGTIESATGTLHAPNFNALSFVKSLRVTSYLGSN